MKYTGVTYRPPFEANSLLLQVTTGCSHNRCSFCTMYRDTPFSVESMEQIEKDLAEARAFAPGATRVFLENGDPFALNAGKLEEIALKIHEYLPYVQTIAMYASINNIRGKSDEELVRLRELGINELNVGIESGLDEALVGGAGPGRLRDNAAATAEILNKTTPYLIFTGTIHADPGCPLYDDIQSGRFIEPTFGEHIDEEELFLQMLELDNCLYFGLHPSNVVRMQGWLPRDKEAMLDEVRQTRISLAKRLNERPVRYGEGAILL